jgi:hypothetical protein
MKPSFGLGEFDPSMPYLYDREIFEFLVALNQIPWLITGGSCAGHANPTPCQREEPYIDVAVRADRLPAFVNLLTAWSDVDPETVFIDCTLNYHPEVVTSCDFDRLPRWVMYTIQLVRQPNNEWKAADFAKLIAVIPKRRTR